MKKIIKTLTFSLASVLGLALPVTQCDAAIASYRFTGTVTDTDPSLPFNSDLRFVPGLEVDIGDRVTGAFEIVRPGRGSPGPGFEPFGPNVSFYGYASIVNGMIRSNARLVVQINGTELSSGDVSINAFVVNDVTRDNSANPVVSTLLVVSPLSAGSSDAFTLQVSPYLGRLDIVDGGPGVLMDGEEIPEFEQLDITLNLTDSSGTVFEDVGYPESLDTGRFDVRKGFITPASGGIGGVTHRGIAFDIETFEPFDPNAPASVEVTTGFHVAWPSDADGYFLEEAGFAEGPWTPSAGTPVVIEGRKIVLMDNGSRSKFYRLTRAD